MTWNNEVNVANWKVIRRMTENCQSEPVKGEPSTIGGPCEVGIHHDVVWQPSNQTILSSVWGGATVVTPQEQPRSGLYIMSSSSAPAGSSGKTRCATQSDNKIAQKIAIMLKNEKPFKSIWAKTSKKSGPSAPNHKKSNHGPFLDQDFEKLISVCPPNEGCTWCLAQNAILPLYELASDYPCKSSFIQEAVQTPALSEIFLFAASDDVVGSTPSAATKEQVQPPALSEICSPPVSDNVVSLLQGPPTKLPASSKLDPTATPFASKSPESLESQPGAGIPSPKSFQGTKAQPGNEPAEWSTKQLYSGPLQSFPWIHHPHHGALCSFRKIPQGQHPNHDCQYLARREGRHWNVLSDLKRELLKLRWQIHVDEAAEMKVSIQQKESDITNSPSIKETPGVHGSSQPEEKMSTALEVGDGLTICVEELAPSAPVIFSAWLTKSSKIMVSVFFSSRTGDGFQERLNEAKKRMPWFPIQNPPVDSCFPREDNKHY